MAKIPAEARGRGANEVKETDVRVLVVGGGVMGLSCAFRLAGMGAEVTVLERGAAGSGATLASLGALWPARPTVNGAVQRFQRKSLWMLEAFVREVAAAAGREVAFARQGHLEFLTSEKAAADARRDAAALAEARSQGDAVGWPTFGHDRAMVYIEPGAPLPLPGLGRAGEFGVLHSRVSAQVEVAELVAALVAGCRARGACVEEGAEVTRFVAEGEWMSGAETAAGGVYEADVVLVTAGAWTAGLHPALAAAAATRPVKGQGVEVASAGEVPQIIIKREKTYVVPWGRRVLIGSTTEKEAGFDVSAPMATAEKLVAAAAEFCPELAGARIVRTWAGSRPDAPKHRPIMGKVPGVANLYVCAGHFKTGIGLSALASRATAEVVLGKGGGEELAGFEPVVKGRGGKG